MTKLFHTLGLAFVTALSLTACSLYFGPDDDHAADPRPGGGAGGGWTCDTNADCAAGCYCAQPASGVGSGVCEEAGFCDDDSDCPAGYSCDDRSSCVPDDNSCSSDADCAAGSFCNDSGTCETSCVCETDAEAQAAGWHHCDETRNTCEPQDTAGTCSGDATCGTRPSCAAGSVALIGADGCYTGTCSEIATCDLAPSCGSHQHEGDCLARNGDCGAIYTGINCKKPDGTACQAGDTNCTCESFKYHSCTVRTSARLMVMDRFGHYLDASQLMLK